MMAAQTDHRSHVNREMGERIAVALESIQITLEYGLGRVNHPGTLVRAIKTLQQTEEEKQVVENWKEESDLFRAFFVHTIKNLSQKGDDDE